jgi:hypothetical protein
MTQTAMIDSHFLEIFMLDEKQNRKRTQELQAMIFHPGAIYGGVKTPSPFKCFFIRFFLSYPLSKRWLHPFPKGFNERTKGKGKEE